MRYTLHLDIFIINEQRFVGLGVAELLCSFLTFSTDLKFFQSSLGYCCQKESNQSTKRVYIDIWVMKQNEQRSSDSTCDP